MRSDRPSATLLPVVGALLVACLLSCQAETKISRPAASDGQCRIETERIDFGAVVVGESRTDTLRLRNVGEGDLSGQVRGICAGLEIVSGGGRFSLAAGREHEVVLRFQPVDAESTACAIDLGTGCREVPITGVGLLPALCRVEPVEIRFADVFAETGGFDDRVVLVSNDGDVALEVAPMLDCPAFELVEGSEPFVLEGRSSRELTVRFRPSEPGQYACVLEFGGGCPEGVALFGRGVRLPECAVVPGDVDFGLVPFGSMTTRTLDIRNGGDGLLTGDVRLGRGCEGFTLLRGEGPFSLAGGEEREIEVRFQASVAGAFACRLDLGLACESVDLFGAVDEAPLCEVEGVPFDFDLVVDESATAGFTLRNAGGSLLEGAVALAVGCDDGAYALLEGGGPFSLARGESRDVRVRFQPTAPGAFDCAVELGDACAPVEIRGTAVLPALCVLDREEIDFGLLTIGMDASAALIIRNEGGRPLEGLVGLESGPTSCDGVTITSGAGAYSLGPGETRRVELRYAPSAPGELDCALALGDDCVSLPLLGSAEPAPSCFVSASGLDFGIVTIGAALERSVNVSNTGGGLVEGTPQLTGAGFRVVAGGEPFALRGGESRTITIEFAPTAAEAFAGELELGESCAPVSLAGTGGEPAACLVSTSELDFGSLDLGDELVRAVVVENVGGSPLAIDVVLESCGAGFELVTAGGADEIPPGGERTVEVRFRPLEPGAATCTLDLGASCDPVELLGRGLVPATCDLSAESIDFGSVLVGGVGEELVVIRNNGESTLFGNAQLVECDTGFTIEEGGGAFSLASGAEHEVVVRFAPAAGGPRSCTLDLGAAVCQSVPLAGSGEDVIACVVTPDSLVFGELQVGQAVPRELTIRNDGTSALSGTVALVQPCGGFFLVAGGGAFQLAPGAERLVRVTFQPSSPGEYACQLDLGATCDPVPLLGSAVLPPECTVSSDDIDLGVVGIGETADATFTIENTGGGALNGAVTIPGSCDEFSLIAGAGSFALGSGQTRTVTLRFAPDDAGPEQCAVSLGTGLCPDVLVAGGGAGPVCQLDPPSLDFGIVTAKASGTSFADRSFTIRNAGAGVLTGNVFEACGQFSIVSGGGSFSLGAGEERDVTVRFAPTQRGDASCTVFVASDCDMPATGHGGTGFAEHVQSRLQACTACHTPTDIPTYAGATARVNTGNPPASPLLRKPAGLDGHGGGTIAGWEWGTGSSHVITLDWIEDGVAP